MVNRVFITLVVGILLSVALSIGLGQGERQRFYRHMHSARAADRIEQFFLLVEAVPPSSRQELIQGAPKLGLQLHKESRPEFERGDTELENILRERLGTERVMSVEGGFAQLRLADGAVLGLQVSGPRRADARMNSSFWFYQLCFLLCIVILAYFVARMTTDPIRRLARAALDLGRDINREPLSEGGPREIRHAAKAFNMMQTRLRKHIHQRNQMLAAISHDLQTPLTRLRLRLEKVQDESLQDKLVADLSAMQSLVAEGLDLARSVESQERVVVLNLSSLLDSLCEDAVEAGQRVKLEMPAEAPDISLSARPNDLRRCLTNLIDNAVKYGKVAHISAVVQDGDVIVKIADEGNGIPPEMLESVFDPFVRLEVSRSRDTGGSGVGLTIARNIAQRHGGELWLENLPTGGLQAILKLPRA